MGFLTSNQKQSQQRSVIQELVTPPPQAVKPTPVEHREDDDLSSGWPQIFGDTPIPTSASAMKGKAADKMKEETPDEKALLFSAGNDMKGELNSSTDIIIEGHFIGPIHTVGNVFIRNGGHVNGDITAKRVKVSDGQLIGNTDAETVIVDGRMRGNIDAKSASFRSGARYKGDVITDELSIADGASVKGSITVHGDGDDDEDEMIAGEDTPANTRNDVSRDGGKKVSTRGEKRTDFKDLDSTTRPGASIPKVVN